MTTNSIADLRKSYERAELNADASHAAPLQQFDQWLKEAISAEVPEPNAMTLADIARAAGVATSTLYVYYPSKDELISQLYQDAKTVTAARIMDGIEPGMPYRARVRRAWGNLLRHRLDQYAEVVFQEQYYNSPWFTEGNREFSTRLMAGFFALMEEGQQQEILKAVPIPLLTASLVGSVRETGNLIRTQVLPDDAAVHQMAFGLCWDAIKA